MEEVEEIYERHRKGVFGHYAASKLLATDGKVFEHVNGTQYTSLNQVLLPQAGEWVWTTEWTDAPWEYAFNITSTEWKSKDVSTRVCVVCVVRLLDNSIV
jgi:hypothetical protein